MSRLLQRVNILLNKEYLMLAIILILALGLRLYKIDNPIADWHSWRQADTASVSRIYLEDGISLLYPRYYDISTTQSKLFNPEGFRFVEFPLYNFITAVFAKNSLFTLEVWSRLVSILSALVTSYFIFLLGKKYLGYFGGLLASFYYAVIPFNVYFTRVILPEPLAICLGIASLWFFTEYLGENLEKHLYISALLLALAILVKPFILFYSLTMVLLLFEKYGIKDSLKKKKIILVFFLSLIPFLLWRIWISQFPEGIPLWKWVFNEDGIRFKPSFWYWIFGERLGKMILGIWGVFPFTIGLLAYKKSKSFLYYFILSMFIYVVLVATANVKHDYYQTMTIPSISLILAYGTKTVWKLKNFIRKITRSSLIVSILLMFLIGSSQIRELYKINRPEIIEAGAKVNQITPKRSLVIAPYNGDTAFLYQTERRGWPVVDRPIEELIEKGAQYFVSVDLYHPQTVLFSQKFEIIEKTAKYVIIKLK